MSSLSPLQTAMPARTYQAFGPVAASLASTQPASKSEEQYKKPHFDRINYKELAKAGAWLGGAIVLNLLKLPPRTLGIGRATLLPVDWKVYARVVSGIMTVSHVNKALDWQPPPWLNALQTVAVVNPLVMGVGKKSMAQFAVMAPMVAGLVTLANTVHEKIKEPVKDYAQVPAFVTRLVMSLGLALAGMKFYPQIYKTIAKTGIFGKTLKAEAAAGTGLLAASGMVTCARGCTPGGLICMSELGEMLGGLGNWAKHGDSRQS